MAPTYKGQSIFEYSLPRSGFEYGGELHWRIVAAWANYIWEDFKELDGDEQASHVMAYECDAQMKGIEAMETMRRARRRARSSGK